jgi:hypothetical protein
MDFSEPSKPSKPVVVAQLKNKLGRTEEDDKIYFNDLLKYKSHISSPSVNGRCCYLVSPFESTITDCDKRKTPYKRSYLKEYTSFFSWLKTVKFYTATPPPSEPNHPDSYCILESMRANNPELFNNIDIIFRGLPASVHGGRRRHSRKYKKSKRVLRRKSRSTRRH